MLKIELDEIMENLDPDFRRIILLNQGKGAGSWLTTVPSKPLGFIFDKQEFQIPLHFVHGGEKKSIDHYLSCKKGGYIHMIHDDIRNLELDEIMENLDPDFKRIILLNQEKGAGSWLTTVPSKPL